MKELHTALFVAPTGVGKTHLSLNLLESEYRHHFNFIVIICPTLAHNETYKSRGWVWTDPDVIPVEQANNLYYLIEKISNLLAGSKTLFLTDDIIADETLDERRQPLLELAISGRHRAHLLWLLTQSYAAVPNNIRRQAKMIYIWYPKNRTDLNAIYEENDIIETPEELARVKAQLKRGKHICLIMTMKHQEPMRFTEFYNSFVTKLLIRDCSTPIKRLHHSYQEITALLSRNYKIPIKKL